MDLSFLFFKMLIVLLFSLLNDSANDIILLATFAVGSLLLFEKVRKIMMIVIIFEANSFFSYHKFYFHKIEVGMHAINVWTAFMLIFAKVKI